VTGRVRFPMQNWIPSKISCNGPVPPFPHRHVWGACAAAAVSNTTRSTPSLLETCNLERLIDAHPLGTATRSRARLAAGGLVRCALALVEAAARRFTSQDFNLSAMSALCCCGAVLRPVHSAVPAAAASRCFTLPLLQPPAFRTVRAIQCTRSQHAVQQQCSPDRNR
jgi:hypothetical protein